MRYFFILILTISFFTCSDPNPVDSFENTPPQIVHMLALPDSVEFNASVLVFCSACDVDAQDLSYHWQSDFGTILGADSVITFVAPDFICSPMIYCTVSDTYGAEDKDSVQVFILESTD